MHKLTASNSPSKVPHQKTERITMRIIQFKESLPPSVILIFDDKGQPLQFYENSEIHTLLIRLIDDGTGQMPQFTDGIPILNTKTAKELANKRIEFMKFQS